MDMVTCGKCFAYRANTLLELRFHQLACKVSPEETVRRRRAYELAKARMAPGVTFKYGRSTMQKEPELDTASVVAEAERILVEHWETRHGCGCFQCRAKKGLL